MMGNSGGYYPGDEFSGEAELNAAEFDWDRAVHSWRGNRGRRDLASGDKSRQQVVTEMKELLSLQDKFRRKHLKELIGILLWKYTEADGKYQTRYISQQAFNIVYGNADSPKDFKNVRHEHVWERDLLIETLLTWPADAEKILKAAVSCTVTLEESLSLNLATHVVEGGDRWERYRYAGIDVIDLQSTVLSTGDSNSCW